VVTTTEAVCVLDAQATLGEGAVWCNKSHVLWWVDIEAPALHRFDPATGADRAWRMPESIGCVGLGPDHALVVALASGLAWFDPETERLERFLEIEANRSETRLNDGRCDRQGRFWVGSMARSAEGARGTLYRCDATRATPMLSGIQVPNSIAFSPDGRTMYFADTPTGTIRAFDLDPATGRLSGERDFAAIPLINGMPDGAAVDARGGLWVAHWDGGRISRFHPDGRLDRSILMPIPRPTCCAFGGADLGTLFVTSARLGVKPDALAGAPLSGGVFSLRPGVRGLQEPRFRLGQ
jgi:sugar lactone lactonase YvrE